jgi:XTP/dITP diphosphohydrolase
MSKLKLSSLVFVSRSQSKYKEYSILTGISDLRLSQITVTEPQSMNISFLVEDKIKIISPQLPDIPFFVEHTGLIIDAWRGLPGGLTHIFMDTVGNQGICKMMNAYKEGERTARAKVVIGYFHQSSGMQTFEGEVAGMIAQQPRGTNNFGWDPIFIPNGDTRTYAEMSLEEKSKTSMRREAVGKFLGFLMQHFEF